MARRQTSAQWKDDPFSHRLNTLLAKSGKTQDDLADACGVSRQTVSKWVRGDTIPDVSRLKAMSVFFEASYDYLLGDSDAIQKENVQIANETGLTDISVDLLRRMNGFCGDGDSTKDWMQVGTELVNCILESEHFEDICGGYLSARKLNYELMTNDLSIETDRLYKELYKRASGNTKSMVSLYEIYKTIVNMISQDVMLVIDESCNNYADRMKVAGAADGND